jgi:pimeloyl-ACP methyl ester carboxylesterase
MKKLFLLISGLCLFSLPLSVFSQNTTIDYLEYFFDADPGYMNGVDVYLSPGDSIDKQFTIDVSNLPTGMHSLYLRARDNQGQWSFLRKHPFYMAPQFQTDHLSGLEYFIDVDPGFGQGIQVPLDPFKDISKGVAVDLGGLSPGVHNIYFRVKNGFGQWSLLRKHIVYTGLGLPAYEIVELEYFIDTDPGQGNGISVPLGSGQTDLTLNLDLNLPSGLSSGLHSICFRAKNNQGFWGNLLCDQVEILSPLNSYTIAHKVALSYQPPFTDLTVNIYQNGSFSSNKPFSVCTDGSSVSTFFLTKPPSSQLDFSNWEFRIKEDPFGLNPDIYGSFSSGASGPGQKQFVYTHPAYLELNGPNSLTFQIVDSASGSVINELPLDLYRPPVVMVHGLWGNASSFIDLEIALINSGHYTFWQTFKADYQETNADGFDVNYPKLNTFIYNRKFKVLSRGIAAGKADLVCHSMGGIITRLYLQSPLYDNDINKLITLNSPHSGSQLANFLLEDILGDPGFLNIKARLFMFAVRELFKTYNGAVDDLRVGGTAIEQDLNGPGQLNNWVVPSHTVGTEYGYVEGEEDDFTAYLRSKNFGALLKIPGLFEFLFTQTFDGEINDGVVQLTSQFGGSDGYSFPSESIFHIGAQGKSAEISIVLDLLSKNPNGADFDQDGFSPPQLEYFPLIPLQTPTEEAELRYESDSYLEISSIKSKGQKNRIERLNGFEVFFPGDTLEVAVNGSVNVEEIYLMADYQLDSLYIGKIGGSSGTFFLPLDSLSGLRKIITFSAIPAENEAVLDSAAFILGCVQDLIQDTTRFLSGAYRAENSITFQKPTDGNTTAVAGQEVSLLAGFETTFGYTFDAIISPNACDFQGAIAPQEASEKDAQQPQKERSTMAVNRIHVFPNPAKDHLSLNWQLTSGNFVSALELISMDGRQFYYEKVEGKRAYGTTSFPEQIISHLESGVYLLRVKTDSEILVEKLVIMDQ